MLLHAVGECCIDFFSSVRCIVNGASNYTFPVWLAIGKIVASSKEVSSSKFSAPLHRGAGAGPAANAGPMFTPKSRNKGTRSWNSNWAAAATGR